MLRADAVMAADQPSLEVGEYEMDDRQEILGHFRIATFGNGVVVVPATSMPVMALLAGFVRRSPRKPRSYSDTSPGRCLHQPDRHVAYRRRSWHFRRHQVRQLGKVCDPGGTGKART